jgi:hypothetical protein
MGCKIWGWVSHDERKKSAHGWKGCMRGRSRVKLHQLTGWVNVVCYIRGR